MEVEMPRQVYTDTNRAYTRANGMYGSGSPPVNNFFCRVNDSLHIYCVIARAYRPTTLFPDYLFTVSFSELIV